MTRYIVTWLTEGEYSTGVTLGVEEAHTPGDALLQVANNILDDSVASSELGDESKINLALHILEMVEIGGPHNVLIHEVGKEYSLEDLDLEKPNQ